MKKKTKVALWIILGVLILAFFTAEIVGLSVYKKKNYPRADTYLEEKIIIEIKSEYVDDFLKGQKEDVSEHENEVYFTDISAVGKFDWWNIKEMYATYYKNENTLYYIVNLKVHGFLQVNEAVKRLSKSEFIKSAKMYYPPLFMT